MSNLVSISVIEYKADAVRATLTKWIKKAAKLGLPPITFSEEPGDVTYYMCIDQDGVMYGVTKKPERNNTHYTGRCATSVRFTVHGEHPHFEGWRFVAKLTPTEDKSANLLLTIPGYTRSLQHLLHDVGRCDHCHTNRQRKDTFVVENTASGELKVIGRNCLEDFLGGKSPEALLQWGQFFNSMMLCEDTEEDILKGFRNSDLPLDTIRVLAMCFKVISTWGFMSKAKGEELLIVPTATHVTEQLLAPHRCKERLTLGDEDYANAETCRQWMSSLVPSGDRSNWHQNLLTLSKQEGVSSRHFAILAAAVSEWLRARAESAAPKKEESYFGEEKKRYTTRAVLMGTTVIDSVYGSKLLHRFKTEEGHTLIWFASHGTDWMHDSDMGQPAVLTFTVKKHEMYRGKKQTLIQRVSWELVSQKEEVACA